ncbi:hypothetical protein BDV26DRAFT_256154 [Aspergillus bertholletiae]|uniref:RZ-type domain-containing protein n=1 Tax=Aspergillus bertholletiae TaxID=1226010 RepID=A0A5N7BH82_9EURO|nr:hypothetical protein BDV26DRAFT_256154 [Aspergillus bertholletiae]
MADSTIPASRGDKVARRGRYRQQSGRGKKSSPNQGQNSKGEQHGVTSAITDASSEHASNGHQGRGNRPSRRGGGRRATARSNYGTPRPDETNGIASRTRPSPYRNPLANSQPVKLSSEQVQDVLEETLSEIDRSSSLDVTIISNWATEAGLARIRDIVEADFARSYSVTRLMFDPHCVLFLRLISYISREEVQRSLSLEKDVGTIFNVIYGPQGDRGVAFFRQIVGCLKHLRDTNADVDQGDGAKYEEVLLHITEAILSTLLQIQEAAFKSELKDIVEDLRSCSPLREMDRVLTTATLHSAGENMSKIRDIFETGDKTATYVPKTNTHSSEGQLAQSEVDLPGGLSKSGPRHDNDHESISHIQILPTLSEIWCSRGADFLPTRGSLYTSGGHHEKGVRRLLDTNFRLLREDTSGILRDAIRTIIEHWETLVHGTQWQEKRKLLRTHSPTPVRIYYGAQIRRVKPDRVKGMEIDVEFDQIPRIKKISPWKRKHYWRHSRALNEGGALLALINAEVEKDITVVFLQVSKRNIEPLIHNNTENEVSDLVSDANRAMITLRPTKSPSRGDLEGIISLATNHSADRPLILVEFPALLYNLYEGILRCLQCLYADPRNLPLSTWIAPQDRYQMETTTAFGYRSFPIHSPVYLEDLTLDLSPILSTDEKQDEDYVATPLTFSTVRDFNTMSEELFRRTTLDMGQARAMISAFKNHLALIQGPPGTGKSYVGIQIAKCLLANNIRQLGPILCVCYTNHALDQFLQGLLDSGISKILRIGSRSASPTLESLSLENYKKQKRIPRVPGQGRLIYESQKRLDNLAIRVSEICQQLANGTFGIANAYLKRRFPEYDERITGGVMIGDEMPLNAWVQGNGPGELNGNGDKRVVEQLLSVDPWTLTKEERTRLLSHWYESAVSNLTFQLETLMLQHAAEKRRYTALFNQTDAQIFNEVDVVGITTTGLANNADLLRSLRAKVLICEEAGEVLESHILTSLLPSIQHAILIGDHLQLRPKISNQRLSIEYDKSGPKYNLDESLFERLVNLRPPDFHISDGETTNAAESARFPVAQLDSQRRMHPSIASLIRQTLYPGLSDHPKTSLYDAVAGLKRRLFWFDHRNMEDPDDPEDPMRSKTNTWEAEMAIAIVRHLCKQECYSPGEIAILTPYIGQLRLLRDRLEDIVDLIITEQDLADLDDSEAEMHTSTSRKSHDRRAVEKAKLSDQVRLATVDNFQGDEATVVIVSLVRSNKFRNCGFLKTPNRINVLLSRAKHGMYIIGNADTASSIPMWSSVIRLLEEGGNIGPKLELECSRHPRQRIYAASPDELLTQAPEGGCAERCERRLACGHTCTFKCHSNRRHSAVKCMKPCTKMRKCGHLCTKRCHESCDECIEKVPNIVLPCGHTTEVECRLRQNVTSVRCMQAVVRKMPGCGHEVELRCHEDISKIKCSQRCHGILDCGHTCQRNCWMCWNLSDGRDQVIHGSCTAPCGRLFTTCSHSCSRPCHPSTTCTPCDKPCEVRCRHSKCPKKCSEPCAPCAERCSWGCDHRPNSYCNLPCAVPCNIIPCDKRCENLLDCGHQCPSICGEKCPSQEYCRECCAATVLEQRVDFITMESYEDINVNENPLVFLSCGHFYTISSLDGIMDIQEYYNIDPHTDTIVSPRLSQRVVSADPRLPRCPDCRTPLRDIHRYNRIVKKALLDESTKRFILSANLMYKKLVIATQIRETQLEDKGAELIRKFSAGTEQSGSSHHGDLLKAYCKKDKLEKAIQKFVKSMAAAEQPYGRVNDFLASAALRENSTPNSFYNMNDSKIQTGFQIRGQCLQLRLTWAILWGYRRIYTNPAVDSNTRSELRHVVANQIKGAMDTSYSVWNTSETAKFLAEQVQAMIHYSLFCTLYLSNFDEKDHPLDINTATELRRDASNALKRCEALLARHQGTLGFLEDDIEKAKRLLSGGTFYSFVTTKEKRQVFEAMATQFSGTGHWYYCRNSHPFTIGECGMPMEAARCPQCGEGVGGHNHELLDGVRRADDIEQEYGYS